MKNLLAVLIAVSILNAGSLVMVEGDIRSFLPLDPGVTVYFVEQGWFLAEAPESWGAVLADSPEGLYLAHLSSPDPALPGEVLMIRDGAALFRPSGPMPPAALPGVRLAVPLRPFRTGALSPAPAVPRSRDSAAVAEIVAQFDEDSMKSHIQDLQDFQTRLCITPQYFESADWVAEMFQSYGLVSVDVDTFDFTFYGNQYQSANVSGEIPGTSQDPGIILITGHLDAITYTSPYEFAPGADDNASGCATVLEAARIMSQYQFPNTVRFVCFGAEELGLIGSEYYAENAFNAGDPIVAVMNLDMVLYGPEDNRVLFVPYNTLSENIAVMFQEAASTHVPELELDVTYSPGTTYSDHASFWQQGYPALLGIEAAVDDNPYYHQDTDILSNYDQYWPFGTECARAALAFVAEAAYTDWLGIEGGAPAAPALSVFPNPACGTVHALVGGSEPESLSLYDLSGRRVLSCFGGTLDVSGLSAGVYFVRTSVEGLQLTSRVVIAR
jgi:hypothetical protein